MSAWVSVGRSDALAVGEAIEHDHRGEPVCIARTREGVFAVDGWCSHEECPLAEGVIEGTEIECYCHGARFDLRTGEAVQGPATEPVETYPVREIDGEVQVQLP
jgi:3-phenylpropionate/trans-cinnamate dioxygenase ferredoxin subunit